MSKITLPPLNLKSQNYVASKSESKVVVQEKLGLKEFVRSAWGIVEPGRAYQHNWHIDAIAEHLEAVAYGQINHLLINVPPGHMKSLLVCVFFPAWDWAEVRPSRRSLFSSYQAALAIRDSVKCRRIIQSPWYQKRYPHIELAGDVNLKTRFENTHTGFRLSTSPGGIGTGERADIVAVDDPHKVTEAESDKVRQTTIDWWSKEMSTRDSDLNSSFIIIMQRVHHGDLSAWAIEQGYEHLCLPGEFEPSQKCITSLGWSDPRSEPKQPLWVERFPPEKLADLKQTLGAYGYAGQIQQRPTPREGGILKEKYWQYYLVAPPCLIKVWAWDTAFKTGNQNDYSSGVLMGISNHNYYVLDVFCDRLEYPDLKRKIIQLHERDSTNAVILESAASGISLLQDIKRSTTLPVIEQKVDKDKVTRVNAIAPTVEAGKVFISHSAPWVADFVMETSQFPNGAHDDRCFVAGTKVATLWGDKEIEKILPGDLVITPYGLKKVVAAGKTGNFHVISRFGLTATPNHPVYSEEKRAFVKMDALTNALELSKLNLWKILHWSVQKQSNLTGLFTGEWEEEETIICHSPHLIKDVKGQKGFMLLYMNFIVGKKFQKATMSIIRTAIRLIIALIIWNVYRVANTIKSLKILIYKSKEFIWTILDHLQKSGILPPKEGNGIKNMERKFGKKKNTEKLFVSNARKSFSQEIPEKLNFVAQDALMSITKREENTTERQYVRLVNKNLFPSAQLEDITLKPALQNAGRELREEEDIKADVYNLTVEGGVYYANAILVHNCDAFVHGLNYLINSGSNLGIAITGRKRSSARMHY